MAVCAYNFNCLNELVVHDTNGWVFNDSNELAEQLYTAFHTFPKNTQLLERLARGAKFDMGWHENWMSNALPVMLGGKEEKAKQVGKQTGRRRRSSRSKKTT